MTIAGTRPPDAFAVAPSSVRLATQPLQHPVGIVGAGYVGLVLAAAFMQRGRHVLLVETNSERLARLARGECPIVERGVDAALREGQREGRLSLFDEHARLLPATPFVFICVGTPAGPGGRVDMTQLDQVVAALRAAPASAEPPIVILKSTAPVGTGDAMQAALGPGFHVVNNPEFLREGSAFADTSSPARTIIGTDRPDVADRVRALYAGFPGEFIVTGRREAEMIKYATNSLLAMRLSAANEIAAVAESLGVDAREVLRVVGLDPRIGSQYMSVGIGYGGSCLPKDVSALRHMADEVAVDMPLLQAATERNRLQREAFLRKALTALGSPVGKTVGVWGLSFKGGTDDLRESPALSIATALAASGARVQAYDPAYRDRAGEQLGSLIHLTDSAGSAARDADLLLVMTDWSEFAGVDWQAVASLMRGRRVFDGRGCIDRPAARNAGLACYAVGVGEGARREALDLRQTVALAAVPKPDTANGEPLKALLVDGRSYLAAMPPESVERAGPPRKRAKPTRTYRIGKRMLDIAVSLVLLALTAVFMVAIALAIRLESGRPIFFRAKRVGQNGGTFTMYKFRTMRVDAAPYAHKTPDNPAVTRVGRLLRLTALDELPQLWNILRGEMSLVGPRPEQPFVVDWYQPWQHERLTVTPGVTGWWQITARGEGAPMYQHIDHDIWYVRHRSFLLDLAILLRTPWVMVRGTDRR